MSSKGTHFQLGSSPIQIGLKWDFFGGEKVDLDATIVMINELGGTLDAVYYNQLTSECSTITHSGDQRDGTQDGYDELISIDTNKINFGITYLPILINAFNGNFSKVETATVTFLQDNKIVTEILLGGIKSENSACLAGIIYRSNGGW